MKTIVCCTILSGVSLISLSICSVVPNEKTQPCNEFILSLHSDRTGTGEDQSVETSAYVKAPDQLDLNDGSSVKTLLTRCFKLELKGSEIKSFAYLDGWKGTGESYLNEQNPVNEQTTKLDSTSMNQEEKTKIDLKSQLSNIPYLSSQLIQHDHIIVVEFQSDDQRKIEEDVVVIYTWFSTKPNEANVFQRHFQNLKHFFENAKWEEICNALNVTSYFGNDTQAYWYVKTRLVGLDVATFNKIEKMAGKSHSIHNQYIFETIVNDNINPNHDAFLLHRRKSAENNTNNTSKEIQGDLKITLQLIGKDHDPKSKYIVEKFKVIENFANLKAFNENVILSKTRTKFLMTSKLGQRKCDMAYLPIQYKRLQMEDRNANILHVHTILQTKTKVSNAQALMVHYHSTRELLLDLKQQEKVLQKLWPFKLIQGENSSGYKTLIYTFFKITN